MKSIDSPQRSIVKSISYRVIATLVTFLISYLWTKDFVFATSLSIMINLVKTFIFYLHERMWNKITFGQKQFKGFTLWFTGLPASGKSTLAEAVAKKLRSDRLPVQILDGDIARQTISQDLGFSAEDREKNIERVTKIAKFLTQNQTAVLCAFVSPYRKIRENARKEIGENFIEVFCKCPVEVCEKRDKKGLYQKARRGEIQNFTGISDPYEEPENPEIVVETDKESFNQCVKKIIYFLEKKKYI